ncbi:MAG TPA: galactokinase [Acidimicrobiia bacterium]
MRRTRALAAALGGNAGIAFVRAPGRVNLIGDHTDYNDGFVLPVAIDRECVVAWRARAGDTVRVHSLDLDDVVTVPADGTCEPTAIAPEWGRLVAGVIAALAQRGRPAVAFDCALTSAVPIGSGLSSSAAFEVALALAALDAAGAPPFERREVARACRDAEQAATGVPCGLMDQLASLFGERDHALLIDCRELAIQPVGLPARVAVLVVHSGVSRALADSAFAERRVECERAATRLGVRTLRDVTLADVGDEPRARHVVSENQRVLGAVAALESGDLDTLGRLLGESHASLRDDFEVSTPELDLLVELLVEEGAIGARLTGAGFGGCVVALTRRNRADHVAARTVQRYRAATGLDPHAVVGRAVDGAGPLAPEDA